MQRSDSIGVGARNIHPLGVLSPCPSEALLESARRTMRRVASARRCAWDLPKERHLAKAIGQAINGQLTNARLLMREGTLADPTILAAPASVKNQAKARAREMQQTKKGKPWHFDMKSHTGVDAQDELVQKRRARTFYLSPFGATTVAG